jgi:hypothetical protein
LHPPQGLFNKRLRLGMVVFMSQDKRQHPLLCFEDVMRIERDDIFFHQSSAVVLDLLVASLLETDSLERYGCKVFADDSLCFLARCLAHGRLTFESGVFYTNQIIMKSSGQTVAEDEAPKASLPPSDVMRSNPAGPFGLTAFQIGNPYQAVMNITVARRVALGKEQSYFS